MQASTSNQGMFWEEARELFEEIVGWLDSPSVCGLEHSEIESKLLENGYELLRRLLQGYFDKRSGDEIEGECTGSDEANRTHKKKLSRKLTTIFGTVIANRIGYGGRKINSLTPLDAELNLPVEQHSHGLRQRVAVEVARSGFRETVGIIEKTTAVKIGKRQAEELAYYSACDFEEFYTQQQAQSSQLQETGEIVVISADGKGVVVRTEDLRADTQKRARETSKKLNKRITKGEKRITPSERKPVDNCARYLLNNANYLRYDHYLKVGLPIATGVIEGACRHLIKDRMDITGARWSLTGAEAVLRLRSLYISGDWDEYWRFHLQQEHQRNHKALYKDGIPLMKQVIQLSCSITPPSLAIPV
jgi:hypothetical protein